MDADTATAGDTDTDRDTARDMRLQLGELVSQSIFAVVFIKLRLIIYADFNQWGEAMPERNISVQHKARERPIIFHFSFSCFDIQFVAINLK